MRVVAIDPGGNTGMVALDVSDVWAPSKNELTTQQIVSGAIDEDRCKFHDVDCRDVNVGFSEMNTIVLTFEPDVVVYETFDLWTLAADITPIELIALMRWEWRAWASLVPQNPSERSVITDKRLKSWGLWQPGRKDVNAAMKHLLVWMRKNQD